MNPNKPMYTTTKFGKDAIDATMLGVREVAEAVATTLGPLGLPVLIDKGYETSIIRDGVNVSLIVNPEEPFARNGAKVMQEATKKQRDEVGDGTTAVCILTMAILDEALKVKAAGNNPKLFLKGLESGTEKVIKKLSTLSTPVKTLEQKVQIATISAENLDLGTMIAETIHKIGTDGVLTVDESKAQETYIEMQEGMQIDKGYAHSFMVTDPVRLTAVLEDCHILVTDMNLTELAPLTKFLEKIVIPNTKKVLFIAPEIGGDFLMALIGAKMNGQFLGLGVRAPGIGFNQTGYLQDICALTGATFISKEAGHKFDDLPFEVLGHANRVISSKISTIIEGGAGTKQDILERIQTIKSQLKEEDLSDYDKEQLQARLAKLTNGVAVIKIGGQTEIEVKEKKERAVDAVQATASACKYGYVPGGEIAYLACIDVLDDKILGEKILKEALKAPFRRLVENAGYDSGELLQRLSAKDYRVDIVHAGFDVVDGEIKDMPKAGIIDPTSVPTSAVKTAVSVATKLSTLGAAITINNQEVN